MHGFRYACCSIEAIGHIGVLSRHREVEIAVGYHESRAVFRAEGDDDSFFGDEDRMACLIENTDDGCVFVGFEGQDLVESDVTTGLLNPRVVIEQFFDAQHVDAGDGGFVLNIAERFDGGQQGVFLHASFAVGLLKAEVDTFQRGVEISLPPADEEYNECSARDDP